MERETDAAAPPARQREQEIDEVIEDEILVLRDGPRVDVVLNRPRRLNAFTAGMFARLTDVFTRLAADDDVRVVVVRGARRDAGGPGAFAAGNDIAMFAGRTGEQIVADYESSVMGMLDALYALPQLSIAAVEGICVGGGLAVATCCDIRIATPEARFGYPIARTLGNALSKAVLARCLHVFGESATRSMLLTARTLDAERACAVGAVLEVAAGPAELATLTDDLVAGAVRASPVTIATTKRQLADLTAAGGDPRERDLLRAVYDSPGFREGVRAFLAKEPPAFPPDRLAGPGHPAAAAAEAEAHHRDETGAAVRADEEEGR